jgi:AcrR family transcriptional regulator
MKVRPRPRTHPEIQEFRRKALIEATIASLARHGVAHTTVRMICAAAGISPGLLTHYYESKDELMAAAFAHLFGEVTRKVQKLQAKAGDTAYARLKSMPAGIFSASVCNASNRHAFLAFWHEIRFSKPVRDGNRRLDSDYTARMQALFAAAAAEQGQTIDSESAAIGYIALVDGLWLELSIDDRAVSHERAIHLCCDYIDRALGLAA